MAGCLKLCFWKKRSKAAPTAARNEKPFTSSRDDSEKPHLEAQRSRAEPASRGVPIRPNVDPVPNSLDDGAKLKDEGVVDPEEAARRKKAEQEEQERMDFFQMM